eukprot:Skav220957  [mRNA]  locus=scaffold1928:103250:117901:+ [translate_table: standard]
MRTEELGDDAETPHTFAEEVAVLIKPVSRDHYTTQLTVRLWADNPAHPRSEQRLLVDFQSFPEQLADLLRRCGGETSTGFAAGGSKMIAALECTTAGESRLSIVESTNFRELIHIDLRLRQGSDEESRQQEALAAALDRAERAETSASQLAVSSLNVSLSTPAKTPSTAVGSSPEEDILSRPVAYRRPVVA